MKAAIYARVSTPDQKLDMQLDECIEYCKRRGWEYVVFSEKLSGGQDGRPELAKLMQYVKDGHAKAVVVFKFDRFARSLRKLITALDQFRVLGVVFVSLHDAIDTSTPIGELQFHFVGALAQYERAIISERVKSGQSAARRRGKRIGRPCTIAARIPDQVRQMRRSGASWSTVAKTLAIPRSTAQRAILRAPSTSGTLMEALGTIEVGQ